MHIPSGSYRTAIAAALLVLSLCGCKNQQDSGGPLAESASRAPVSPGAMGSGGGGGGMSQDYDEAKPVAAAKKPTPKAVIETQPDRFLIKNAILTLEVADARSALGKITSATQAARGYLSDMRETADALGARTITVQ